MPYFPCRFGWYLSSTIPNGVLIFSLQWIVWLLDEVLESIDESEMLVADVKAINIQK